MLEKIHTKSQSRKLNELHKSFIKRLKVCQATITFARDSGRVAIVSWDD